MRSLKTMSFILLLFIPFLAFTGCSNDDNDITLDGEVYLTFVNHPNDLHVVIYSMENTSIPLYDIQLNGYTKLSQSLNVGNYIIQPKSDSYNYGNTAIQIQQGRVTSMAYDAQNTPHISIK